MAEITTVNCPRVTFNIACSLQITKWMYDTYHGNSNLAGTEGKAKIRKKDQKQQTCKTHTCLVPQITPKESTIGAPSIS